jgi:nitrate reductase gamma subunit
MNAGMDWKKRTYLIAGIIGLLTGIGTAYFLVRRAESEERELSIDPGDGIKLGLTLLGALRQVGQLTEGKS